MIEGAEPLANTSSGAIGTDSAKVHLGKRHPLEITVALAVLFAGLWCAHYTLATRFRAYDDEGYMMLSLRSFLTGHPLYSETYTQYGPFFFFAQSAAFRVLNLPVEHDTGRLVTFLDWVAFALLGSLLIYRISRSLLLSSSAGACCLVVGSVLASEPGHPQQIILPLFALAALLTSWPSRFGNLRLALVAAIGAALVFTKINIGLFYFIALAYTIAILLPFGRARNICLFAITFSAAILPYLVFRLNWFGVQGYFISATLCIIATFGCGLLVGPEVSLSKWSPIWAFIGAVFAAGGLVLFSLRHGTSFRELLAGVVIEPMRHPHVFGIPYSVSVLTLVWTLLLMGGVGILALRARQGFNSANRERLQAVLCVVGVVAVSLLVVWTRLSWAVVFLPFTLISLRGERSWNVTLLRLFLTVLAVVQYLGQYPVGGSQVGVSAAPVLLWGFVSISDGLAGFVSVSRRLHLLMSRDAALRAIAGFLLLQAACGVWIRNERLKGYRWPASRLPGASSLHLEPKMEARFEFLSASIHRNCDMLFTMPGMGSFNFWSRVPPPNDANVTAWVELFRSDRQSQILHILQAHPSGCVIYNADYLQFWHTRETSLSTSPLANYILKEMSRVAERDGYEIRVHPSRRAEWIK